MDLSGTSETEEEFSWEDDEDESTLAGKTAPSVEVGIIHIDGSH